MLSSTCVGRPRSVTKTGSASASRLALPTSGLNSRAPTIFLDASPEKGHREGPLPWRHGTTAGQEGQSSGPRPARWRSGSFDGAQLFDQRTMLGQVARSTVAEVADAIEDPRRLAGVREFVADRIEVGAEF